MSNSSSAQHQPEREGPSLSDLCCIFCCPPLPYKIVSKLAFLPPKPTYKFVEIPRSEANPAMEAEETSGESEKSNAKVSRKRTPFSRRKNANKKVEATDPNNNDTQSSHANTEMQNQKPATASTSNIDPSPSQANNNQTSSTSISPEQSSDHNATSTNNASKADEAPKPDPYHFPRAAYRMEPNSGNFFVNDYKHYDGQLIPSFTKTKKGNKIACTYIKYTSNPELHRKKPSKFVILFSHGNAVDIGQMPPFYTALARALQTDILSYDYSGYGESSGSPSEANIYADARAAFQHLQDVYKFKPHQIIIYGQSIGSVATLDLASKKVAQNCPAIVLHSPLLSGIKVIAPNHTKKYCIDPFPSYEKIKKVTPKVLVIHGTEDEVINFSHGLQMYELAVNKFEPLWVDGAGHNDIEHYPVYAQRLKKLIKELHEQYK